jgi:GH35 family endo-1,4-beta-xylanase
MSATTPATCFEVSNGGFDNATLIKIMQKHITNKVMHYKGDCLRWDVVNEGQYLCGFGHVLC